MTMSFSEGRKREQNRHDTAHLIFDSLVLAFLVSTISHKGALTHEKLRI